MNATDVANPVSWGHFFDSLKRYYVDLRHDNVGEYKNRSLRHLCSTVQLYLQEHSRFQFPQSFSILQTLAKLVVIS